MKLKITSIYPVIATILRFPKKNARFINNCPIVPKMLNKTSIIASFKVGTFGSNYGMQMHINEAITKPKKEK
jgi:hypothetical protein